MSLMAQALSTAEQPLGRGRIVTTKRGRCVVLAEDGPRLVLCPLYEAPDLHHRADIPLSWRDELILGLKQNAVIRAIPFLKQRNAVIAEDAYISALTLTQLRLRTHRELQISTLESKRLPLFSGRPIRHSAHLKHLT